MSDYVPTTWRGVFFLMVFQVLWLGVLAYVIVRVVQCAS